ncbi:MAG: ATP-binding protein [Planctomycetia bacterium]|nr:ATP-binding protein [Planctomycetia bacterium]
MLGAWLSSPSRRGEAVAAKSRKKPESVPPSAADLIESLRDFGYTLSTALADLIDNSLAALASKIEIVVDPSFPSPHIAVLDDGLGMDEERLVEAMRMATIGPLAARNTGDLGRFGLGMKTASLSQGRCFTVITKRRGKAEPSIRRWDLEHVRTVNDWELLAEPTPTAEQYLERIHGSKHGTAIIVEQLDRVTFVNLPETMKATALASVLDDVRRHLGMVFHRFIAEDGLIVRLGETAIHGWDPYVTELSTRLPTEQLRLHSLKGNIEITPFVLPHHSRLTDEEHERAAGPYGWNAHQGFYIYRCKRLIVPGTWLNLKLKKEEHLKLARIRVDLPNTMDAEWQLNVMKSHVAAPSALRDDFRRIAADVRRQASDVYRVRGERQAPTQNKPERFVWCRQSTRTGVRYKVDRTHPVLKSLLHAGCDHDRLLSEVVTLIESTLPIASMLQEHPKAIDGSVPNEPPLDIEVLVDVLLHTEQHFIRTGMRPEEARKLVLSSEPFVRFKSEILDRVRSRTNDS